MKPRFVLFLVIIFLLTNAACTKHNEEPPPPLLQSGTDSATLGKLIYLPKHSMTATDPVWGKNTDELFVTTGDHVLKLDFTTLKTTALEDGHGMITGSTNEHQAVIFLGTIDGLRGYYKYIFNNNKTEGIMSVPDNYETLLNMAGNNIFFYSFKNSTRRISPCWGWCWETDSSLYEPSSFFHLDKTTSTQTNLKDRTFYAFSKDGSKTILQNVVSSWAAGKLYLYDNVSRKITDSVQIQPAEFSGEAGRPYYDNTFMYLSSTSPGRITFKNLVTKQILLQFQSQLSYPGDLKFSADHTKIYYSGTNLNGTGALAIYDLTTNQEKIIAQSYGGFGRYVLSDDNKKIVFAAKNDLYLKELN